MSDLWGIIFTNVEGMYGDAACSIEFKVYDPGVFGGYAQYKVVAHACANDMDLYKEYRSCGKRYYGLLSYVVSCSEFEDQLPVHCGFRWTFRAFVAAAMAWRRGFERISCTCANSAI